MTEYAFPRDLIEAIKTRWQTAAEQQFELPEDRILQRLLETCYHASFRTSEQRVVQCIVAYASFADIRVGALRLSSPVVLTDSELVRVSPVTLHRQTVIGCEEMDGLSFLRKTRFSPYRIHWEDSFANSLIVSRNLGSIATSQIPPKGELGNVHWGMRHQSVFSVCHKREQAIGLIVSQDGELKAVKADGGRLIFWDRILD